MLVLQCDGHYKEEYDVVTEILACVQPSGREVPPLFESEASI